MLLFIAGIACVVVALFLGFASVGGLTAEKAGVGRSVEVIDALTSAPKELRDELDEPFMDRVIGPLLAQFQTTTKLLTPSGGADRIREKLEMAGNPPGWTVERIRGMKALGLIGAVIVGAIGSVLLQVGLLTALGVMALMGLLGYFAPSMYIHQLVHDRSEALKSSLADAIDLLTISVEAGLAFDSACAQVARNTDGPLAGEFARMLQEMQIGKTRAEALRSLGARSTLPDLRSFVSAMVQADAFGIPIGQVLRVQSSEIRVKKRQWAEEAAQKVPVKILPPLICFILPCLFIAVLGPAGISIATNLSGM